MAEKVPDENVHRNHRERVKNRFLRDGLESFEKHNILELLLFYSVPQRDTNALAHRLLERFGSISGVFDAPFEELCALDGVGAHTATLIKLIPALSREYLSESDGSDEKISNYEYMGEYFVSRFVGVMNERVICVLLDNSRRIISSEILSEGGASSTELPFRAVTEAAIKARATFVVLAHNHPHGEAFQALTIMKLQSAFHAIWHKWICVSPTILSSQADAIQVSCATASFPCCRKTTESSCNRENLRKRPLSAAFFLFFGLFCYMYEILHMLQSQSIIGTFYEMI